jgi:3-hydroxybutyryl-CoA dehydrogenase
MERGGGSVVVVGAGLMGVGIGQVFAQAGHRTILTDSDPARRAGAPAHLREQLAALVTHGMLDETQAEEAAARVGVGDDLGAACRQAANAGSVVLVVEAVSERLDLKRRLMAEIEHLVPADTLLATNTSGLSVTSIGAAMDLPERLCGMHFWNPPHLLPLVEVVRGGQTSDASVEQAVGFLRAAGKEPVIVRRDVPGFLGNRLLHALQREAMALVDAGVASAEDIDLVVTQGFGRRLGAVGPLAVCDLAGLDLVLEVDTYLLPDLEHSGTPSPTLVDLVRAGDLGAKTGRGFHDWSPDKTQAVIAGRDAALMRALLQDRRAD